MLPCVTYQTITPHQGISLGGLKKWTKFIYPAISDAAPFFVGAVAAHIFLNTLVIPAITIGCCILAARATILILDRYTPKVCDGVKKLVLKVHDRYPKFYLISVIACLLVSLILPTIGTLLAVGIGIYQGILTGLNYNAKRLDQQYARMQSNPITQSPLRP